MVRLFGFELSKSRKGIGDPATDGSVERVAKDFTEANLRPYLSYYDVLNTSEGVKVPIYPIAPQYLYDISQYSDVLRNIFFSLRQEIFRNGISTEAKFKFKCIGEMCAKEFQSKPENDICDECGGKLRKPSIEEERRLRRLLELPVNFNNQKLDEVLKQCEDDLQVMDNMFLVFAKDYEFLDGKIISAKPKEIFRGNPLFIQIIADNTGMPGLNESGIPVWVCVNHRYDSRNEKERPVCQKDGLPMQRAFFVAHGTGYGIHAASGSSRKFYYIEGEVLHAKKYSPSLTYGFPQLLSVYIKALTLIKMDRYIFDYYKNQRPPMSLLLVNTKNQLSLHKAWEMLIERVKKEPHFPHPLAVETNSTRGQVAQVVRLMESLSEMQFTEAREEMRRSIGAAYGVMPLFQGDLSASSGLNNEGLQVTVTNRAVESGQGVYNTKAFPFLCEQLMVNDWVIKMNPNEEKDEMAELQRESQKIQNASGMKSLGYEVDITHDGMFKYRKLTPEEEAAKRPEPALPVPAVQGSEQQFTGEPESVRRSFELRKMVRKSFYTDKLAAHGDSPEGVGWMSKEAQEKRFAILQELLWDGKKTINSEVEILDAGCGTGAFHDYLVKHGYKPKYSGIDKEEAMVSVCKAKGLNAEKGDVESFEKRADYIVCSGVFNQGGDVEKAIRNMWRNCLRGMAINMLAKAPGEGYVSRDPEAVYDFSKTLDPNASIYTGYYGDDFTIIMRKAKYVVMDLDDLIEEHKRIIASLSSGKEEDKREVMQEQAAELERLIRERVVEKNAEILSYDAELKEAFDEAEKVAKGPLDKQRISAELKRKIEDSIFQRKFKNLTKLQSDRMKIALIQAFRKGMSLGELVKTFKGIAPRMTTEDAELVIRTEQTAIQNTAREHSYQKADPEGGNIYLWMGPSDRRTTKICKEIERRAGSGVGLPELRKIILEESKKGMGEDWQPREWVPHPNCRRRLLRTVR